MTDPSAAARALAHSLSVRHHEEEKPGFVYLRRRERTEGEAREIQALIDQNPDLEAATAKLREAVDEVVRLRAELMEEKLNVLVAADIANELRLLTTDLEATVRALRASVEAQDRERATIQMDADHDWALWCEKWRATMDTFCGPAKPDACAEASDPRQQQEGTTTIRVAYRDPDCPECVAGNLALWESAEKYYWHDSGGGGETIRCGPAWRRYAP